LCHRIEHYKLCRLPDLPYFGLTVKSSAKTTNRPTLLTLVAASSWYLSYIIYFRSNNAELHRKEIYPSFLLPGSPLCRELAMK
jgi:hypothetical protein